MGEPRVALVHDELTRRGGAEHVLEELIRLYPQAHVYALYAGQPIIDVDGTPYPVTTTFLQRLPRWWRRHPSRLAPLLPLAAEQLDLSAYDIVISSSSGFAKAVVTRAGIPHVCYCHTPPRYVWEDRQAVLTRRRRFLGSVMQHYLRLVDAASAARVDTFIANSRYTQERILSYYRRDSTVVYPPIDTTFFHPGPPVARLADMRPFLCVGRLTPSKRFEHAITVCEKLALPLVIIGSGRERFRLRRLARRHTTLFGTATREALRSYLRSARALLQPGVEDFGLTAAEALACGTPVIAYGVGGVRDIVRDGETGYLYEDPLPEALAAAIHRLIEHGQTLSREAMQKSAMRFTSSAFRAGIQTPVQSLLKA